jgi:hypothetical protein
MRALAAIVLALLAPPAATLRPLPAQAVSAHLPGLPCSVSATLHPNRARKTMSYGGGVHCTRGIGEKTVDVVPQVSNVIAGKQHWFNVELAGRYQGPAPIDPLEVSDHRPYVPSHSYRLLVYGRVTAPNGHSSSVTVCSGCSGRFAALAVTPSGTFHAGPATAARVPGTSCSLSQDGVTFTLVNGSYVVNYGAHTDCPGVAAKRTVTACVQVVNRIQGRNVWFTDLGSCLSTGPTRTDPTEVRTARTAYLGHGYRIMAKTTVTQGTVARSATVYSGAAAP